MRKETILNPIQLLISWLVILFPFLIIIGKGAADSGVVFLCLLFLMHSTIQQNFKFLKEKWIIIALILWIYLVIRSLLAPDMLKALAKSLPFVRFIIFAACIEHVFLKSTKYYKKLLASIYIVLAFLILDGLIQFLIGHDIFGKPKFLDYEYYRLTGPFSKKILGVSTAFFSIIGIANILPLINKPIKYLFLFIIILLSTYTIILLSGERAALLQITFGITLLFFLTYFKYYRNYSKKIIMLSIGAMLGMIVLTLYVMYIADPKIIHRQIFSIINALTNYKDSHHIYLWLKGIKVGLLNVIFGVGPNHFESFCKSIQIPEENFICSIHPHNIYIEFFAESGIVGLFLLLLLLYTLGTKVIIFYISNKNTFLTMLALGTSIAATQRLLPFIPSSGFFKNWHAIPIWFAIGCTLNIIKNHTEPLKNSTSKKR